MKIYIAAAYPTREQAVNWADWLRDQGHTITSEWLWTEGDLSTPVAQQGYALKDVADIDRAEVLLIMTGYRGERAFSGGRHWETGYAYGRGKRIIVAPQPENVFHHLPGVVVSRDLREVQAQLEGWGQLGLGRRREVPAFVSPASDRRTEARQSGFTGDMCGDCGSLHMVRNGTCLKCNNCGATTGCS